jgi:hypothetical protein
VAKATPVKRSVKSFADFRAAHDKSFIVPTKIQKVLADLGEEGWLYEAELCKEAGVSPTDVGRYREQFEDHVVTTGGRTQKRVWFGSKKVAAKAREVA